MRYKYRFTLIGFGKYELIKEKIEGDRPAGFYWIKYENRWITGEWFNKRWILLGDIGLMKDDNFQMICEERIEQPNF